MIKIIFLSFFVVLATGCGVETSPKSENNSVRNDLALIKNAYENRISDLQVGGKGRVIKVLSDDNKGSRHQRFILKLESQQTLLIAHNIDLAPRIPDLEVNDTVAFYGEYEWTKKGGVVHWTHLDPRGNHAHGWLKHEGNKYQ